MQEINIKNHQYFIEYNKLMKINMQLQAQYKEIEEIHKSLKEKKEKELLENKINPSEDQYLQRKRVRRKKSNLLLPFQCFCGKSYGSESSKNQHIKLKHKENETI
jgi:hypothetical protein